MLSQPHSAKVTRLLTHQSQTSGQLIVMCVCPFWRNNPKCLAFLAPLVLIPQLSSSWSWSFSRSSHRDPEGTHPRSSQCPGASGSEAGLFRGCAWAYVPWRTALHLPVSSKVGTQATDLCGKSLSPEPSHQPC